MKVKITLILVFLITTTLFAQNGAFSKGDKILNIGLPLRA